MKRRLYLAAGIFFTGLGAIGAVLPLLPTVPFLLLAVFCFARSNKEWEQKILDHPRWGPMIEDWRARGAISRPSKIAAIATIAASVPFTYFTLGYPWVWISITVLFTVGTWIATRAE